MELNTATWKPFFLKDLFLCQMGNGIDASVTSSDNPQYNYVSRNSNDNGVVGFVDEFYRVSQTGKLVRETPFETGTMTLALGGSYLGSCFVQERPYYTAQNVAVLTERESLSKLIKIFIATLIRNECKYKYLAFGRELNTHYKTDFEINLPILRGAGGEPVIDKSKGYSSEGYVPDWGFIDRYMMSLHGEPIRTVRARLKPMELKVNSWKEFEVGRLFKIQYGINMELNTCDETTIDDDEGIAFVARTAENNGVSAYVKSVSGKTPQPVGIITVAGGGSVLSTFVQKREFYSGRDLYLLLEKENISLGVKLFIITVLSANQYRYSYGRQSNRTLPSLLLKLPIQHNTVGKPVIDPKKTYSEKGYIPDWRFMEDYINSLPYSDRIVG